MTLIKITENFDIRAVLLRMQQAISWCYSKYPRDTIRIQMGNSHMQVFYLDQEMFSADNEGVDSPDGWKIQVDSLLARNFIDWFRFNSYIKLDQFVRWYMHDDDVPMEDFEANMFRLNLLMSARYNDKLLRAVEHHLTTLPDDKYHWTMWSEEKPQTPIELLTRDVMDFIRQNIR